MNRLLIAVCMLLCVVSSSSAEVVFRASFDSSTEPETSAGKPNTRTSETPPRYAPGIQGQAVVVGARTWVTYDIGENLKPAKGSISFLTKPIGWNGNDAVLHFFLRARAASGDWLIIYKVPENELQFTGGNAKSYSFAKAAADTWKDGEWKHVCVTWTNQDAALYVDGVLAGKGHWPVLAQSFGEEFTLGGAIFGESRGEQAIDELSIHDTELSAAEVAADFAKYKAAVESANQTTGGAAKKTAAADADRVIFRASFDGKTDADVATGTGTSTVNGKAMFTDGLRGKAILIDAATSVDFPLQGNLNPASGTISFWAKPVGWSGSDGGWHYFVILQGEDDWILLQTVSNSLTFLGGTRVSYSESATPIADWPDGTWRFVTVTWDNGKNQVYLDGRPALNPSPWPRVPMQLGSTFRIGGQLHGESNGRTAIQDFQIRDVMLSPEQVKALYSATADKIPSLKAQAEMLKQQQVRDPLNVATEAFRAILLPSSQAYSSALQVENLFDGDFETRWLSASGTFPNWIEVRWPQPMTVNKLLVNENPSHKTAQYRIDAFVKGQWTTIVPQKPNTRKAGEQIVETFPPIETFKVRYVMLSSESRGDPKTACSLVNELQVCSVEPQPDLSKLPRPAWQSHWIWYPEDAVSDVARYFRTHFQVDDLGAVERAILQIGADDSYEVHINGKHVGSGGIPTDRYDVAKLLVTGDNVIAVKCHQFSGFAGLICELAVIGKDSTQRIITDQHWKTSKDQASDWNQLKADESNWKASNELGIPPNCPDHADQTFYDEGGKDRFELTGVTITPGEARPGDAVDITIQLSAKHPVKSDYAFTARIGERKVSLMTDFTVASKTLLPPTPTSQWKTGEKYTLKVRLHLPDYSPHGTIPLFLTPVGPDAQRVIDKSDDGMIGTVKIRKFATDPKPWPTESPNTEVRNENGHPKLYVNGQLLPPQILTENTVPSYEAFGQQAKTGIRIWRIYANRGKDSKFYPSDKERERRELCAVYDQYIEALLKVDPDAYILVGHTFNVSQEWTDKYPDDAAVLGDGLKLQHSFSSRRWIAEVKEDVNALVKHFTSKPYSGHVIGFHFGIGAGPETYYWGLNANSFGTPRDKVILGDHSPEHLGAFRAWLRKKYPDEKALRTAWKDDAVTFDTAKIDQDVLRREDLSMFKDPAKSLMPFDYWEFHSDVMAQRVIDIATAIKQASGGKYLTGFWGLYSNGINALTNNPGKLQQCAYTGLQKVLESPAIDYIAMLQEYLNVRWGTPVIPDNLTQSIRSHNKLCLIEYDMRTFFTPIAFTERTFSQQETLSVMRRDIAGAVVRGDAFWWVGFPLGSTGRISVPWFAEESIVEMLTSGQKIVEAAYRQDYTPASQIAVFVNNADVRGLDVMTGNHLLASTQYNVWANELTKIGAPFDQFQLDDVALPGMDRYKVYFFLNAFNVSDQQREAIGKLLAQSGKTAVWLYAPGFCNGQTLSEQNIEALTGFKVTYENHKALPEIEIDPSNPFSAGVPKGHRIKPRPYQHHAGPFEIGPIFETVDPDAKIFGKYVDSGKSACAVKKVGNSNSIYVAIPYIDATLARSICKAAGVHLYSAKDVFLDASHHFLSITATDAGFKSSIKLPGKSSVYDIFNGKMVATDVNSFSADVLPLTTSLYYIGSDTEVKSFAGGLKSK